jgi:hypothetical protein
MLEGEPIAQKKRPVPKRKFFRSVGPFSLIFGRKFKTDAPATRNTIADCSGEILGNRLMTQIVHNKSMPVFRCNIVETRDFARVPTSNFRSMLKIARNSPAISSAV